MLSDLVWQDLLQAVSLVMVIEGILPFLSPKSWRQTVLQMLSLSDQGLRVMGLVSMLAGILLLYTLT